MSEELDRFRLFQRELQREAFVEVHCPVGMGDAEFKKLWNAVRDGLDSDPETKKVPAVVTEFKPK